ncbi:MAG TPA: imidazoleglycerol-phosphate dehydratase HisB [Anaerolineae bacterium]|nr:imidazoleglycerol-phosphate dehydratase HisB [Anaerolineae bacterium]HIP71745.1 imidazoleglycerol-phosphate dehydratase HisB [Anaerolineae bacterium]
MERTAIIQRQTSETDIVIQLNLDGTGQHEISTEIGFLDHMLTAVAVHGLFDLIVTAKGDLYIDNHHTIEDTAIVLGRAFDEALGDRKRINRVGHAYVPMDEALGFVALDFSGRPYTVFQADWGTPAIGQFPTDLVEHFFESFAVHARLTLHARVDGRNDHHKAEALFKALARALATAVALDPRRPGVASTKGTLTK